MSSGVDHLTGVWAWTHPDQPSMAARRRRYMAIASVLVLAMVVAAGVSARDADPVGLLLSVTVGPGLAAALLTLFGYAFYVRPSRFVLSVAGDRVLRVTGVSPVQSIPLAGARRIDVRLVTTTTHTHRSYARSSTWHLQIDHPAVGERRIPLPGALLGARTLQPHEAAELERSLRWFAGLPDH